MKKSLQLWVIKDGKLGHENQSMGLAEAMARLTQVQIHCITLDQKKGIVGKCLIAIQEGKRLPKPDLVIATGHSTHLALLAISKKYRAKSIVLMRPSLPVSLFDYVIAPAHDFVGKNVPKQVILSKGALNRVRASQKQRFGKLLLVGGPSKTHGYDEQSLIEQIQSIAIDDDWMVADSRRTPQTFLIEIKKRMPALRIFPHQETNAGWLAGMLSSLEKVWVTEDSVSMIYEALSSGAKVGVLKMPRLKSQSRVLRGLEMLQQEGYFSEESNQVLAEADRCAREILQCIVKISIIK